MKTGVLFPHIIIVIIVQLHESNDVNETGPQWFMAFHGTRMHAKRRTDHQVDGATAAALAFKHCIHR